MEEKLVGGWVVALVGPARVVVSQEDLWEQPEREAEDVAVKAEVMVAAVADWPAMCVCRCKAGRAGRSTRARGCCLKR